MAPAEGSRTDGASSVHDVGLEKNISGSGHANREGTLHQSELGPKPKRKHFFSPLDHTYADAVHRDAEAVDFTPEEEVRCLFVEVLRGF